MSGNTALNGANAMSPMVMPTMSTTRPRVAASARQPSRMLASTCWLSVAASCTVGIFASARPATATSAPKKSRNMTEWNPRVVYRKMPNAGAPMLAMDMSSWSIVLMRSRCFSGTSRGMAAIMAGPWNDCPTLRTMTMIRMRPKVTCPMRMTMPSASDTRPIPRSAAIMTVLRLYLSAMTPPKGDSSPCGR